MNEPNFDIPVGLALRERSAILSVERLEERCFVHFDGDMQRVVDALRACTPLDTVDQIRLAIDHVVEMAKGENPAVTSYKNRFAVPAASGYSDFKFRFCDPKSHFVSTGRFVHRGYELQSFFGTISANWMHMAVLARQQLAGRGIEGPSVIVTDNFHRDDETSCHVVWGFNEPIQAANYAKLRIAASLIELKDMEQTSNTLWGDWILFGIDACTLDGNMIDYSTDVVDALIPELPLLSKQSFTDIESQLNLRKFALV